MLCEPLQVIALKTKICCLHKVDLCERKACADSELGQTAAFFCLLLCWKNWILGKKTAGQFCPPVWPSQGIALYECRWPLAHNGFPDLSCCFSQRTVACGTSVFKVRASGCECACWSADTAIAIACALNTQRGAEVLSVL